MGDNQPDRPFPTPPYPVQGTHPADIEPQTSWSTGGLRRLGGVINGLNRDGAELAAWWNDTPVRVRPHLDLMPHVRVLPAPPARPTQIQFGLPSGRLIQLAATLWRHARRASVIPSR